MKRFLRKYITPELVGFVVIVVVIFRRAIVPPEGWMLFGDDIHRGYYFFREFFNHWVSRGVFPWWNPYLFGGMPFIADPIVNIWYPVNWIFSVLPLNLAYSWHVAFHLVWAGLGMSYLMKSIGINRVLAWTSGLLFMLSGFFMARTWNGHVDVIAAASWMPWVVHAFERVMRSQFTVHSDQIGVHSRTEDTKSIVLAGVVFALQLISGYQTMAFMTGIMVGIMVLVRSVQERSFGPVFRAATATGLGLGLAAFHLLPVTEFFRASVRTYHLPYSWVSYGSWTLQSMVQLLDPFFFGDQRIYNGPPPNFGEHSAFIGITGFIFMIVGVYAVVRVYGTMSKKRSLVLLGISAVAVVVMGIWMSLGAHAPIDLQYIAWKIIPMYQYLRIPTRHLILVVFGLSLLSGIGMSYCVDKFRRFRWVGWGIVVVVVLEMVPFGWHFIEMQPTPHTRHEQDLVKKLTDDAQPYRVVQNFGVWIDARDALDFDSVMPYGVFSATGYSPSILRSYYEFVARSTGSSGETTMLSHDVQIPYFSPANGETMDFLNIKYILVPPDHDPFAGNSRYRLIWDDDARHYRLYENTTVYPRFFLSDRDCGGVHVDSYTPNRIVLAVETTCDATLISSEVWYPGWRATIDGKKANIDKTNNAFRTLFVSSGKHTVTYEYFPGIYLVGWGGNSSYRRYYI